MQRLSGLTMFYKRILPAIFVGAVVFFIIAGVLEGRARTLDFFITPLVVLAIGCAVLFFISFGLADEVTDHGAYLLVRMGSAQERIALANIKDIKASWNSNPPVMTLHLVEPCRFGASISFLSLSGLPFAGMSQAKVIDMLLQRADAARRQAQPVPGNAPRPPLKK